VAEVKKYFKDKVFKTIIHRNSKIGEAPNMHIPIVLYDATSKGTVNFLNLAREFLNNNEGNLKVVKSPTTDEQKKIG
jgi:chromosome partitioning protein